MKKFAMKIRYDGTCYHGFQRQKNGITVQQVLEEALTDLLGEKIEIVGCSRTDAGVHALEFVFHFESNTAIPAEKLPFAINHHLPEDIAAMEAWEAEPGFHARFDAKGKRYEYRIHHAKQRHPFLNRYSWHIPYPLDVQAMKEAAPLLEGTHDFAGFMAAGGSQKTTVRTIRLCRVTEDEENPELVTVTVEADAFLYNMVRIITGTLVEVGYGRIQKEDLPRIIAACDRTLCGLTAPPQGLFLKKVYYDLG